MQTSSAELSPFLSRVLARCLDIRAIWATKHDEREGAKTSPSSELLAFANRPTLEFLRKSDSLHSTQVDLLVVIDGDVFENAWGQRRLSGSLARWAWRQVSPEVAYYDESRWLEGESNAGGVVRVRRKAILLWQAKAAAH